MPELVRGRLPDRSEPGRPQRSRKGGGPAVKAARPGLKAAVCGTPSAGALYHPGHGRRGGRQGSGGRRGGRGEDSTQRAVPDDAAHLGISSTRFLRQKEVELARVQSMLAQTVVHGKRHTELYEQSQAQIHELTSELEDLKVKAPARGRETNRTDRWSKSPSRRASVAQVDANWALLKTSTESRFFKPNLYHSRSLMAGFSFCMRASSSDTLRMSLSKLCSCIWLSWSAVGRSHVWPIIKAWPCWSRGSTCRRSCRR